MLLEEAPEPAPEAGQVLVEVLRCGICGSDLHALHHLERMRRWDGASREGAHLVLDPAALSPHTVWTDLNVPATIELARAARLAGRSDT